MSKPLSHFFHFGSLKFLLGFSGPPSYRTTKIAVLKPWVLWQRLLLVGRNSNFPIGLRERQRITRKAVTVMPDLYRLVWFNYLWWSCALATTSDMLRAFSQALETTGGSSEAAGSIWIYYLVLITLLRTRIRFEWYDLAIFIANIFVYNMVAIFLNVCPRISRWI